MPDGYYYVDNNAWYVQEQKVEHIYHYYLHYCFFFALAGMRTQAAIGDVQYMKGMIPHHSIAILTSKNADIKDPEVRKLADRIIAAQEKEIDEMKAYIKRLESSDKGEQ